MKLMLTVKDIKTNQNEDFIIETARSKGNIVVTLVDRELLVPLEELMHILNLFKAEAK